jgi:LacI family transcriptional regulator
MAKQSITITDVARRAGVSISTVSRVLNNSASVSQELQKKVLQAAKELDYQPNKLAQGLRRKTTGTVGVIIPSLEGIFFHEVIQGIERSCYENNHTIHICTSEDDPEKEIYYTKQLRQIGVDGIIFVGAFGWEYQDHIYELCQRGLPVTAVNREITDCNLDLVLIDKTKGNYLAASHLLELDHTTIGSITILTSGGTSHEQVRGFREALRERGNEVREDLILEVTPKLRGGYEGARELLNRDDPPTALFVRADTLAIGAMRAIKDEGLQVPDDISVVGFSDLEISKYLTPSLTSVRQPAQEMGMKATSLLFDRFVHPDLPQRRVIIEPTLIIRESTQARQVSRSYQTGVSCVHST